VIEICTDHRVENVCEKNPYCKPLSGINIDSG
jgi:hypothetical protein